MADSEDILNSLLTQTPYTVRNVNTEDFIEKLHRENLPPKEFGDKFNAAVKQNLRFGVTIPSDLNRKDSRE
jgi:hypothetical protein